ncbi:MAG TPA: SUMF1/EgtB/PvdO family nonheme iron enzyme [Gemmataceae bacterium]|nr:SUMF1/EgtB/PvdO family nonheme iron enzyme [Gemmataceae bacterium]
MAGGPVSHPSPDVLRALAAGRLDAAALRAVLAHFDTCPDCRQAASTLAGDDFLHRLRGGRRAGHGADAVPPGLRDHADFEVIRKLGGGGMGVVYLARDRLTQRLEALKVVNPSLATHPGVVERFLREIRAVVQLLHPNIVTAYGALQVGGLLVLKMEYVSGQDLNTLVTTGGPLPVVNACSYVRQAAAGLQYAFGKGMVHRDVKPANLILARDGKSHVVKILDFGLVKAMAAQGARGEPLTLAAQGMGTPAYMAPEQAKDAARADIRADVYGLGCTLYFLLAGRAPFAGRSPYDLWEAHRSKRPTPLNEVRKDVPAELAAVAARMMAKDPARRYQEPAEAAHALEPFVKAAAMSPSTKAVVIPATPRARRRTRAMLLSLAGMLLLGGAVFWVVIGRTPLPKSTGAERPKPAGDVVARVKTASDIDLVEIPSGSFFMGSPLDDAQAEAEEKPQHKVTISRAFYLGTTHVTVGQLKRFVEANPTFQTEAEKAGEDATWKKPGFPQADDHPVVWVSWHDADAFCRWLAQETGATVRLPTEAEWEYACRAVTEAKTKPTTRFFFGDDVSQLGDYAWWTGNSALTTYPCGRKKPNAFGLYDMHGLVYAWCADGRRVYKNQAETDPMGPVTADTPRGFRGGSFVADWANCRCAFRGGDVPSFRHVSVGFRVLVER